MSLQYFIPDWDDRVDPHYNFLADTHTVGRDPYRDDVYAHELYTPPPYDGVLLSRAVLDASPVKYQAIRAAGSVHRYLRLPEGYPVMGDCGAFSYWKDPEPPYQTEEMLDFYQHLGFDIGVSIDHLIFAELDAEKERRWQVTLTNAEEFLKRYRQGHYTFIPMGVAQGWNPESYQRAAQALVQMGYTHMAIGGLVRSPNSVILQILAAVREVVPRDIRLHLFGVSRPEYVPQFLALGVTSFDSASRLRRAWMDGRRNYFLGHAAYSAIRIPEARTLARKQHLDEPTTIRMEQAVFAALRAFDQGAASLEATWEAAVAYAALSGKATDRLQQDYRETLEVRPWRHCPCAICRAIGVEVIIFRGNNRNRRRGFHNTWQLYQYLQGLSSTDDLAPGSALQPAEAWESNDQEL